MSRRKKSKNESGKGQDEGHSSWKPMLHTETKRGIVAIVLFIAALVLLLAFGGLGGKGGAYTSTALQMLLGKGFLLVPLSLILAAFSIFTSLHERFYAPTFIGSGLFLMSFEGVLHLFFSDERGGGWAGYIIAEPLARLLNFWPTLVILVGFIVISLIIAFNIPLRLVLIASKDERGSFFDRLLGRTPGEEKPDTAPAYIEERKPSVAAMPPATDEADKKNIASSENASAGDTAKPSSSDPDFENEDVEEPSSRSSKSSARTAQKGAERARRLISTYVAPPLDLLDEDSGEPSAGDIKTTATVIKRALATFGIEVEMSEVNVGPTVTQYTLRPASGIKLARITALHADLALALAAHPIRIEAPIPGRSLVGIEIPNTAIMLVRMRGLVAQDSFRKASAGAGLALVLGRDVAGRPSYGDLERMPHLLIAGATGSGKSICIHSVLTALLYQGGPETTRFILIDPKRVELTAYNGLPHLLTPVITEPAKMVHALRWAVREMESRYERLSKVGARDIAAYNRKVSGEERLPYVVVVIDELADVMAAFGKEVEGLIVRLAQMARAIGIHLIVSTQRPSVEVITGLIKANITSRIAFQVASQVDSRTILDSSGAEKLLGRGDMLYLAADAQKPKRIQSVYVSDKEVERITSFIREHNELGEYEESVTQASSGGGGEGGGAEGLDEDDPMVDQAENLVIENGKASATFLQRYLRIGYARAARILDILESRGVVGPADGAKPREIYGRSGGSESPDLGIKTSRYTPPKDVEDAFADEDGEEVGEEEVTV